MKTKNIFTAAILVAGLSLTSCRETVRETEVREVEVEREKDEDGLLERTGKEVDKKVNQEINEEIEKIGDDN